MSGEWTDELEVYCADIGSIAQNNFAWARRSLGHDEEESHDPGSIEAFASGVAEALVGDRPVALGFEVPLFGPVPEDPVDLAKARPCDHPSPAWCSPIGGTVLVQGLVQMAWIFDYVKSRTGEAGISFDWEAFASAPSGLFVWEAFISGADKGATHEEDAQLAVAAFCDQLPTPGDPLALETERPLSFAAATAMWGGWDVDPQSLRAGCLVVRPGRSGAQRDPVPPV